MQVKFAKPLLDQKTTRSASLCLYNPISQKRKNPEQVKEAFEGFKKEFKKHCPNTPIINVEYDT